MRREYIPNKGYQSVEMWVCEWWNLYKTDSSFGNQLRENFLYTRPLSEEQLLQLIVDGELFG